MATNILKINVNYEVSITVESYTLSGNLSYGDKIDNLDCAVQVNGEYAGNIHYSEHTDANSNLQCNVPSNIMGDIADIVMTIIADIKTEFTE